MLQRLWRHDVYCTAGGGLAIELCRKAGTLPHVALIELLDRIQLAGRLCAAVVAIALCVPQPHHFLRGMLGLAALNGLHRQLIAAHLAVVLHAELGQQALKVCPLPALAQQQQPVIAHAVFLVGAAPALQKCLNFRRPRSIETALELPVRGPRLQGVTCRLWQERGQSGLIALSGSFLHLQQNIVPRRLGSCPRNRSA